VDRRFHDEGSRGYGVPLEPFDLQQRLGTPGTETG